MPQNIAVFALCIYDTIIGNGSVSTPKLYIFDLQKVFLLFSLFISHFLFYTHLSFSKKYFVFYENYGMMSVIFMRRFVMQHIMSQMRAAIEDYRLIENGDRIAIGLSGGKDSLVMLCALANIRRFFNMDFDLVAVTVDPCFDNTETDFSQVQELCRRLQVKYEIRRSELSRIIFDERKEQNPCSLCARMRRGILHDICKKHNCNKLALGHHLDDAVQTFFMNLFYGGKIGCFSPKTYLSRKELFLIRPMIFCRESKIEAVAYRNRLPVVVSACPVDGHTCRQSTQVLIEELERKFPDLRRKVMGALQRADIDGWGKPIN